MATEIGMAAAAVMYHYAIHDAHGYTQGPGRTGSGTETIDYEGFTISFPGGDGDCSDGNIRSWRAVGRVVGRDLTSYATCTANIKPALLATGLWEVWPLSRRGDICPGDLYLKPGRHVAMAIDKIHLAEFWINEKGAITGGHPGDQTGQECRYRTYYDYPWQCIMHYCGPDYLLKLMEDEVKAEDITSIWNYDNAGAKITETKDDVAAIRIQLNSVLNKLSASAPIVPFGGAFKRFANPTNGAHVYTNSVDKAGDLIELGWDDEGEKFALGQSGEPVYELLNPYTDDCILTTNADEAKTLARAGWQSLGIVGTVGDGDEVHSLYNDDNGLHLYTTDTNEVATLADHGWRDEGSRFRAA